jgi:Tfp pilus assembly protein PilV
VTVLLPRTPSTRRRGFSHVEVLVSTLIVGLMLVSATNLLGGVVRSRAVSGNTTRAVLLAQEMMCEIANVAYAEASTPLFGPEAAENTGNRSLFDDVDDYNGWTESPLKTRENATIANTSGWTRSITVAWVDPAAPSTTVGSDQGVKRITIVVQRGGQTLARLSALRTNL